MPEARADSERFLGGRVIVRQPEAGYRAAVDSVLLGCAVSLKPGERALELGCGVGTALIIAAWRNQQASLLGVERERAIAAAAQDNVQANALTDRVAITCSDALGASPDWREGFDHVFANPPFFDDPTAVRPPQDPARRAAFVTGEGGLGAWVAAALAAVPSRGRVTLIHRADRLDDLLGALNGAAGGICVRAVQPRAGAPAKRVLVTARKGVRTPLTLLAPLSLHAADGGLTPEAATIIEAGGELSLLA